jgi:hypothetical protein
MVDNIGQKNNETNSVKSKWKNAKWEACAYTIAAIVFAAAALELGTNYFHLPLYDHAINSVKSCGGDACRPIFVRTIVYKQLVPDLKEAMCFGAASLICAAMAVDVAFKKLERPAEQGQKNTGAKYHYVPKSGG